MTDNKKLIQKILDEVINKHDASRIKPYVASNYQWSGLPVSKKGLDAFKEALDMLVTAFPDAKVHVEAITGDGDYVATRGYMTGTNEGSFMGNAPTHKKFRADYIDFWKVTDGKIVANWVQIDTAGIMSQLGIEAHAEVHH